MGIIFAIMGLLGVGATIAIRAKKKATGSANGNGRNGAANRRNIPSEDLIQAIMTARNAQRTRTPRANIGTPVDPGTAILQNRAALDNIAGLFPFVQALGGCRPEWQNPLCYRIRSQAQPRTHEEYLIAARRGVELLSRNRPIALPDGQICSDSVLIWSSELSLRDAILYDTPVDSPNFDRLAMAVGTVNERIRSRTDYPFCVDIGRAGLLGII